MMVTVADDRIQDIPRDFPSCHHFSWSHSQFMNYIQAAKTLVQHGIAYNNCRCTVVRLYRLPLFPFYIFLPTCICLILNRANKPNIARTNY